MVSVMTFVMWGSIRAYCNVSVYGECNDFCNVGIN